MKSFWVVSPNVGGRASEWVPIILREHIAVMGWSAKHKIGERFTRIPPKDVILIARRHRGRAEPIGFGVVWGSSEPGNARGECKRFDNPTRFGSLRNLAPFVPIRDVPRGIPLPKTVNHSMALVKLHPKRNPAHKRVCDWMEGLLRERNARRSSDLMSRETQAVQHSKEVRLANLPGNRDYDYKFHPKRAIVRARKKEARLLEAYRSWIEKKHGYVPKALKAMGLTNDCFDERRCNLIEAKASVKREDIRMAVGQLFDYGFYAAKRFGKLDRAILLPKEPAADVIEWLQPLDIGVIWRVRRGFRDNAGKRFV